MRCLLPRCYRAIPLSVSYTHLDVYKRQVQELAYLYGFEQFNLNEDDVDSETMNYLLIFMGVMFGVQGATGVLKKLADVLAKNIAKKLAQKSLTKGVVYPIVKDVYKRQLVSFIVGLLLFAVLPMALKKRG